VSLDEGQHAGPVADPGTGITLDEFQLAVRNQAHCLR
jgi:hypothetical protein